MYNITVLYCFLFSSLLRFWLNSSNNFALILKLSNNVSEWHMIYIISEWPKEAVFVITTVMHRLNQHVSLTLVNL